jgi:hypothetical protein
MFSVWRTYTEKKAHLEKICMQLQIKTALLVLRKHLVHWGNRACAKMDKRKMKAMGKYLFIAKMIKKCLDAMRKHARCAKATKIVSQKRRFAILGSMFDELKLQSIGENKPRWYIMQKMIRKSKQAINFWRQYAFHKRRETDIV